MRTLIAVALLVLVTGGSALAQPGQMAPPQPMQPQPMQPQPMQPQPMQPNYGYAPQRPVMQVQLTLDEQYLLERGYITDGEHIGGGIASVFLGWGIGQAIQGRWSEKGYIFTLGEGASVGLLIWGMVGLLDDCFEGCADSRQNRYGVMLAGGLIGITVFRIWEIVDAFAAPSEHNRKLTELRMRLGYSTPMYSRVTPFVVPSQAGDGALAGVALRF